MHEALYENYVLCDPRKPGTFHYKTKHGLVTLSAEPFYVGKGKPSRKFVHERVALAGKSPKTFKERVIKKIHKAGLEVLVIASRKKRTEEEAFEVERELIRVIGRRDLGKGPLTNLTDGGDGPSGQIFSAESKKKLSQAASTRTHSKATRERMSNSQKGHAVSEATRKKIGDANRGRKMSEETRALMAVAAMGHVHSNERNKKISETLKGRERSAEHCANISKAKKGKPSGLKGVPRPDDVIDKIKASQQKRNGVVLRCPHCKKEGRSSGMKRWHFDNCAQA